MGHKRLTEAELRKRTPVWSGFIKYFPLAILEVARLSQIGNDQHNPGEPLRWDREKSKDEKDALSRHLIDEALFENGLLGERDTDEVLHLTKVAWRGMASLQKKLEQMKERAKSGERENKSN